MAVALTRPPTPVLLYFCYGAQEIYDQAIYSILSLLHVSGGTPRAYRIVAYADRPAAFGALPIETVEIDSATLDAWLGGSDYLHRRKTCAIIDALERFDAPVAFIDSDTWFRRAPNRMLRRIGPGRAIFHLCEGYVAMTGTPADQALARQLATGTCHLPARPPVTLDRRTRMWNTGVVGIDPSDLPRLRDALALSDAIWAGADPAGAYGKKIHHAEQFATGHAFADAELSEAADCVYHYWPQDMKQPFARILPELARSGLADHGLANLAALYAWRPRETGARAWRDRLKMAVRRLALATGLPVKGYRRSV